MKQDVVPMVLQTLAQLPRAKVWRLINDNTLQ
jgi:hypothetical protein